MFKKRNRAWLAALLAGALVAGALVAGALVAGLTPQASATTAAPDRPTGLTADLDDGGVLLSWDAPDETVDSWQVWRRLHPAETAHTVVATVDGELNEWTDTDLTAGDRRYKVAAVRDSLTSRRSRFAKLMLEPPPRPTGLTADLDDGGVLLSWDAPAETVDSWEVLRKFHPAETTHTVVATVDGELNEWTDADLTAGDRRYKVAAVRDSLTSQRSRPAKLVLDEPPPPPLRPTPGTITQVPEKELLTERGAGDTCTPAADSVTATLDTWMRCSDSSRRWRRACTT